MAYSDEDKLSTRRQEAGVAVIGLGRFGQSLALALVQRGCRVLGIDKDAVLVQRLSPEIPRIVLDTTSEDALREIDITAFDAIVVAIESDFESSLMTTVALKKLGASYIVCQSATDYEREILLEVGADWVVEPERDAGRRLARELMVPGSREHMALGQDHSIFKFQVPEALGGESLAKLSVETHPGITVLAIQRDEETLLWPRADMVLLEGDLLVMLGSNEAIASLHYLF